MPDLAIFPESEMPDHLRWQIVSFFRVEWSNGFRDNNLYRDWISTDEDHLVAVVITQDKLLISYAGVVWKSLEHEGQSYKMYGLSGVFTFPSFRKQGYGTQVVKAAKKVIEDSDGDIAIFTSTHRMLYENLGFRAMPHVRLLSGNINAPVVNDELTFMLFLSPKGLQAQSRFEKTSIYFGSGVW